MVSITRKLTNMTTSNDSKIAWDRLQMLIRINIPNIDKLIDIEKRVFASAIESHKLHSYINRPTKGHHESHVYLDSAIYNTNRLSKLIRDHDARLNEIKDALEDYEYALEEHDNVLNTDNSARKTKLPKATYFSKIPIEHVSDVIDEIFEL